MVVRKLFMHGSVRSTMSGLGPLSWTPTSPGLG